MGPGLFSTRGSPGSVQGQTGASQCGRIANALYIVEQECDSNSSLFWSSFIVASRSLVICHEPKMVLFVPNCRLPDIQDFRVIFTSFLCVFSPLRQRQLADLQQGLHSNAKHSSSVDEILWLWEHRVVETKGTEVSGTIGRPRRKIV